MATCSLRFYKNSKLKVEKNWCFDNIETYLASLTYYDVSNYQYQRFELDKEIRVDFAQNEQTISPSVNKYDYLRISTVVNNAPVYYYYFIIKTRQVSESTIAYQLRMDTLNTFKYDSTPANNKYTLSSKTLVKREHKDRFDTEIYIAAKDNYYAGSEDPNTEPINNNPYLLYVDDLLNIISTTQSFNFYTWHYTIKFYNGSNELTEEWNCKGELILDKFGSQIYISSHDWDNNNLLSAYLQPLQKIVITLKTHPNISDSYTQFYTFIMTTLPKVNPKFVYARKVDEYQEGLSTTLFKKNEATLYDLDEDRHWYVVYASANAVTSGANDTEAIYVNPVKTRIYSDDGYTLTSSTSQEITLYADSPLIPKYQNMGEFLQIKPVNGIRPSMGEQYVKIGGSTFDLHDYAGVRVYRKNNYDTLFYKYILYDWNAVETSVTSYFDSVTFYGINTIQCVSDNNMFQDRYFTDIQINSGTNTYSGTSSPWEDLDRSDSRLIKAFVFPYAPCNFLVGKTEFENLPNGVSFSTDNVIELGQNIGFNYQKKFEIDVLKDLYIEISDINAIAAQARDIKYESKLFHSDYYQIKFVYDSFSFGFMYENVNYDEVITQFQDIETLYTTYVISSNVQSKFMFKFDSYILKKSFQDYDNVLTIERNNEKALFNNAYINYVRSGGYSYDTKKASSQNAVNGITTALSIVGSIASFASSASTGAVGIAGGIGLAINAASGIIRSVHTAQEQDRAISQKLMQLQMQGTSVQGSEDIDILTAFSGNKPKIVYYELSDIMKSAMYDLFYYCGYATHEQKKPVTTGRLYFNFIQAEIIFESYNFNEDIADDIQNKWNEGVTFFHAVSGAYDIDQQYENFEISLM